MCRLAAYIGQELLLSRFLQEPSHSLIKQSWAPEELNEAKLNVDGFGFAWYSEDNRPAVYTNILPIWSDTNIESLGRSLRSNIWLANVRSATPGQDISQVNTQPFVHENFIYLHNGYLDGFNSGIKQEFHRILPAEIQADIRGNTDSEYIFALFRKSLSENNGEPADALLQTIASLDLLLKGATGLMNIIICDGEKLLVCRHAFNKGEPPSLYFTTDHPDYPGASLVASERLSKSEAWIEVESHSLMIITSDQCFRSVALT